MKTILAAQTPSDKLEKTRQSLASLHITLAYQYIIAGIVGAFFLRNVVLVLAGAIRRRRRTASGAGLDTEKGDDVTPAGSLRSQLAPFPVRLIGAVDRLGSTPVWFHRLGPEWTLCRTFLFTVVVVINIAFCLAIDSNLRHPASARSNIARSFSRRCGRMAIVNLPILFATMGRNNPVSLLTGFDYQSVRVWHKLLGIIVILQSFIHTIAYTGYYVVSLGVEALHEEYTELYFKLGIAAMVAFAVIGLTSIPYFRRKSYELFLVLHVVCAAVSLAGCWYHRPIAIKFVYASVGFWVFERCVRVVRHIGTMLHTRLVVRRPLLQAEASVSSGAIVLKVPFQADWTAGQHFYISFWNSNLLSSPWLFGQSHPFSSANVPHGPAADNHLHFVLRIHDGITKALASRISKMTSTSGKETCMLSVSAEGPYGAAPHASESDSVLLVAGGSGVTHVSSVLGDIVTKAEAGVGATKTVRLVWAIHHLRQAAWLGSLLEDYSTRAQAAGIKLETHLFVTRPDAADGSSQESTPTNSPRESKSDLSHEKGLNFETNVPGTKGAIVHSGRPDVGSIMREVVKAASEHTFVLGCGPTSLVHAVRAEGMEQPSHAVTVEIASFEC
ncbi:hypothetical protein RQP46_004884 [Phenoliferia psychrophenolica]